MASNRHARFMFSCGLQWSDPAIDFYWVFRYVHSLFSSRIESLSAFRWPFGLKIHDSKLIIEERMRKCHLNMVQLVHRNITDYRSIQIKILTQVLTSSTKMLIQSRVSPVVFIKKGNKYSKREFSNNVQSIAPPRPPY